MFVGLRTCLFINAEISFMSLQSFGIRLDKGPFSLRAEYKNYSQSNCNSQRNWNCFTFSLIGGSEFMHKVIISFFFIGKCMQHARAILKALNSAPRVPSNILEKIVQQKNWVPKKGKRDEIGKHTISVKLCFEPNSLPHENHVQKSNNSSATRQIKN